MTDSTDRSRTAPPEQPQDVVAQKLQRAAATIAVRHGSDINATVPAVEYDPVTKRRYFDTAPVPLRRMFASPLAMLGPYALGPNRERKISSGWGDPRSTAYDTHVNSAARHQALDFTAPIGETVSACADGRVTFVGFQQRVGGGLEVDGIHADTDAETILNGSGNIVASKALGNIGFGGICIFIQHDGDFEGYRTEYFHLSDTNVRVGQRVLEGAPIGKVGTTGGYYGFFPNKRGPHLHFQISLVTAGLQALVRPTGLVPNYWPGHTDSTNITSTNGQLAPSAPNIGVAPAGTQIATNTAQGQTQASDRATIAQNQGAEQIKQNQARYADLVADRLTTHQGSFYATVSAFQGAGITVSSPMTFDFTTGTWSDGQPV